MQFNGYGGGGGRPNPQSVPDAGDTSLKRLHSELAAANDMINLLISHIQTTNSYSGEYDTVIDAIEQRRVSEVANALDQIALKRSNNHNHVNHNQRQLVKISESGFKQEQQVETEKESKNSHGGEELEESKSGGRDEAMNMEDGKCLNSTEDEKGKDDCLEQDGKNNSKNPAEPEESEVAKAETEVEAADESGCPPSSKGTGVDACTHESTKLNLPMEVKIFAATEMCDEMLVNVVHGLKLYEEVIGSNGVSKFVSLVNDLRAQGRAGKLVGQTYSVFKRPMRGRGKEVIQLGLPVVDAPVDYNENNNTVAAAHFKARKVEPIPAQLQDFIDQLVDAQILSVKPDSCIIDLYNEGNYSQPHMLLPWFGRPTSVLFLSQCDMTFGRAIKSLAPGNYKGSIDLSFAPGSLVVMEGQSADFSYHTINAMKNQRMLITFTKLQSIRSVPPNKPSLQQSWPLNGLPQIQHPTHHLPHLLPANSFMPVLMPIHVLPPLTCAVPDLIPHHRLVGWQEPQHHISGTGVFLPFEKNGSESAQQTNLVCTKGDSCQVNRNISTKSNVDDGNSQNHDVNEETAQQTNLACTKGDSCQVNINISIKSDVDEGNSQNHDVNEEKEQQDGN